VKAAEVRAEQKELKPVLSVG
jgi:hypothetical protein